MDKVLGGKFRSLIYQGNPVFKLAEYSPTADCPLCQYSGETSGTTVTFYTLGNDPIRQMNIYHESGHLLDNSPGLVDTFSGALDNIHHPTFIGQNDYLDPKALKGLEVHDPNHGSAQALQHPATDPVEQWADIFANVVAGNINDADYRGRDMLIFFISVRASAVRP